MSTMPTPATFADAFAFRDGIIASIYEVDPARRLDVIADFASFAQFGPDTDNGTATALSRFWQAVGAFFELDAANPNAAPGSEAWKQMRHLERAAGIALMQADIRDPEALFAGVFEVN
jgi:hypothetical protein